MPVPPYAADLVRGVASHSERIDALISWNLVDWTLERMPAVDRNVLRLGVYELLWADDVPDGVAISEAVALAEDLSTDASPSFVNGVLSRLKAEKPTLDLDPKPLSDDDPDADDDDDDLDDGFDDLEADFDAPGATRPQPRRPARSPSPAVGRKTTRPNRVNARRRVRWRASFFIKM